ncbi:hypothetical protein HER21_28735 [Pseudomonas sp. BGM005]|nr:hypothetical protein [Pseudomonas sp. BG5]
MRYAYFDLPSGAVMSWIDTEAFSYSELPDASLLFTITSDQDWHQGDGQAWYVVNGALTRQAPEPEMGEGEQTAQQALEARSQRAAQLYASDWLVLRHRDQAAGEGACALTAEQYAALLLYRQALRDVPEQPGFPASIAWPPLPDALLPH